MIVKTVATITADGTNDVTLNMAGYKFHPEMLLEVEITGTITVQVLGSLKGTQYTEMLAASATGQLAPVAAVPYLRIVTTATSGGTAQIHVGRSGGAY